MILNQSQAQAVYDAMCALNNVSGVLLASITDLRAPQDINVNGADGGVVVRVGICGEAETYASQAAFAAAYNLGG